MYFTFVSILISQVCRTFSVLLSIYRSGDFGSGVFRCYYFGIFGQLLQIHVEEFCRIALFICRVSSPVSSMFLQSSYLEASPLVEKCAWLPICNTFVSCTKALNEDGKDEDDDWDAMPSRRMVHIYLTSSTDEAFSLACYSCRGSRNSFPELKKCLELLILVDGRCARLYERQKKKTLELTWSKVLNVSFTIFWNTESETFENGCQSVTKRRTSAIFSVIRVRARILRYFP